MKTKIKQSGFSIYELLLTFFIINIIAALLFSGIMTSKEKSKMVTCINNQRNITGSLIMYAVDNDAFPDQLTALLNPNNENMNPESFWALEDHAYATNAMVYLDGSDKSLVCPSNLSANISYGMNQLIQDLNYSAIHDSSKIVILSDTNNVNLIQSPNDIDYRHQNSTIVSFSDGHVETVAKENIYAMDMNIGGIGFMESINDMDANFNQIPDIEEIVEETFEFELNNNSVYSSNFGWVYVGIINNGDNTSTITFTLTNDNNVRLVTAAFQLPSGAFAVSPTDTYQGSQGSYNIVNGSNATPFYSLEYQVIDNGIKNGQTDTFSYTLNDSDLASLSMIQVYAKAAKNNNGHGNNIDGVDSSNTGNSPNAEYDPSGSVDDEIYNGNSSGTVEGSGTFTVI